jgi:hypothetical protein|tara:strand:+ start:91 stop:387 length:297 start_codon:yes stop_codon:yes gene_type:complete
MQNHHLDSVSTCLQFFTRLDFFHTEPISAYKYTMLGNDLKIAGLQAVIVLAPTYTVAYLTEQMVYTIPMLAASSFVAAALRPNTSIKVDDASKDGGKE